MAASADRPDEARQADGAAEAKPEERPGGVRDVKSAARTLELLELLAARQNRPARLRELSEALGMPRSSCYALLRTLAKYGWVRTDTSGTMYGIGIRALIAGTSYLDTDPYLRIAKPVLDHLGEQLDETFHFGRLDGTDVVYLATRESGQYLRPYSRVGRRLPAYSTSLGKALLAERDEHELGEHLPEVMTPLTPHTLTDRAALTEELTKVRERGYAVDQQENSVGLHCVALPMRYATPALDAISCSVPLARLTPAREADIIAAMRRAREEMERSATSVAMGIAGGI
ncbi:IclR family transcriptional regulator [Actinoalloteichus hymeniacidonis]|uniref:Glycerol operon regulatory protein n=1 Tax=Actinoalloteichus hymeniacidonis TaxID=340345 RepID=A0AAC9HSS1_9PSEU|nr:IclR family transcriptional regulator [Actinoalloteichus hymeniacidonis]AOS64690.1 transcriptional regulator, IclR family [Actinoalloteichus hymeniacidonis]MBB5907235.1 DNA-binding IclR family transcriptional regulator [Actinoalloteichus hymeniacidonis]